MTCSYCGRPHVCASEDKTALLCLEHYESPPLTIEDRVAAIEKRLGQERSDDVA